MHWKSGVLAAFFLTVLWGCPQVLDTSTDLAAHKPNSTDKAEAQKQKPTVAEAQDFLRQTEVALLKLKIAEERAMSVQSTYITDDTDIMVSQASENMMAFIAETSRQAAQFDGLDVSAEMRRKLDALKLELNLPAPSDATLRSELASLATSMKARYGKGKYCPGDDVKACRDLGFLSKTMASSHKPAELLEAW